MRVSVIATVLNEEDSIRGLLSSLLSQTIPADEIILVDGGSTDNTVGIINEVKADNPTVKLFIETGNIAKGRNFAVSKVKNSIIAQTDAGCELHNDWLKEITKPFKINKGDLVVAGFYHMIGGSAFQKALAPYCGVLPSRYDPRSFMPSGRSMAFTKSVFEKVGGYKESLDRAGEDTLFNYEILKNDIPIIRAPDALVDWQLPKNLKAALNKFYWYSKGDAQANIWWHPAQGLRTHNIKILSIFARYAFMSFLFLIGFLNFVFWIILIFSISAYSIWTIRKNAEVVRDFSSQLWLPIIQVMSDVTIMSGFIAGFSSTIISWGTKKTH